MCDAEERFLREQLAILHRSYLEAAQPILARLAHNVSMQNSQPIFLSADQIDPSLLDELFKR